MKTPAQMPEGTSRASTIRRYQRVEPCGKGVITATTFQCANGLWAARDSVAGTLGTQFPTEEAAREALNRPMTWNYKWAELPDTRLVPPAPTDWRTDQELLSALRQLSGVLTLRESELCLTKRTADLLIAVDRMIAEAQR